MPLGPAVTVIVGFLGLLFGYFRRTSFESMAVRGLGGGDESSVLLMIGGGICIFFGFIFWMMAPGAGQPADVKCPKCGGANSPTDPACRYCSEVFAVDPAPVRTSAQDGTMPSTSANAIAEQIERLVILKQQGALSDSEFQTAKVKLLS